MDKKMYGNLSRMVWLIFVVIMGLTIYVNYSLPHGSSYATGEIVCQNDGRGPCGEQYKEDMRGLDIPEWAKFLRGHVTLFLIGLPLLAWYFQAKSDKETD